MKPNAATVLGIMGIAACILWGFLWGGWSLRDSAFPARDGVADRIQKTHVVRAAYFVGAPLWMIDPVTHQKSGLFYEAVEAMAAQQGWRVDWVEEVGYGQMIEGLNAGRYDLVGSGVWITPERVAAADFSNPLFYDTINLYVRADDHRFDDDAARLNDPQYTIAVMDGEMGMRLAQQDFPRARQLSVPQQSDFTQMIQNVLARKADVVFLGKGAALAYMAQHPASLRQGAALPVRIFGNALMIAKGQPSWGAMLNGALNALSLSGQLEAILRKYEAYPDTYMRAFAGPLSAVP